MSLVFLLAIAIFIVFTAVVIKRFEFSHIISDCVVPVIVVTVRLSCLRDN